MMRTLLILLACCATAPLYAAAEVSEGASADAAQTVVPAPAASPGAPAGERHWRLGIALGFGERSNPLIQSDDIPVLVDLDIAWFGERWFFDNGDLGFAFIDNRLFTANLVARVNSDRVYFSKTNTRYVTLLQGAAPVVSPMPPSQDLGAQGQTFVVEPPDRDYAIELGVEMLMDGAWGQATLSAFHDVSGTHDGFEVGAEYGYRFTHGRLSVSPSVGARYKSAARNDYYWGVRASEANGALPAFQVDEGINWQAGVRAGYYLTRSLRLALSANYERLDDNMAESPLVEDSHVVGYFAGLAWQF